MLIEEWSDVVCSRGGDVPVTKAIKKRLNAIA